MEKEKKQPWSVAGVMNDICNATKRYPAKVRDYVSPSDLGKSYWDRYQKMNGVKATNPYPDRVLRVFAAGDNVHMIMGNVFKAAGILIEEEGWVNAPETKTMLKLKGRFDVVAGGKADVAKVKDFCERVGFNDFFTEKALQVAEGWNKNYPEGADKLLYEFKSVNSQLFWAKKDYLQDAYPWHRLQCYAYLRATGIPEGRIFYISKDDWTTVEFPVFLSDPTLKEIYEKDVETMTKFILEKKEPPKPEYIVFDERQKLKFDRKKVKYEIEGKYCTNWEVERSSYFTLMTGEKTVDDWKRKLSASISEKNAEWKEKCIDEGKYVEYKTAKQIEIEIKVKVSNPKVLLEKMNGKKPKIFYVKDEIFGKKKQKSKIRKRTLSGNVNKTEIQKTTPIKTCGLDINKKIEESLTHVPAGWKCENSYDKVRFEYERGGCDVMIDFYSIGCFVEIEGTEGRIKQVAKGLGIKLSDNINNDIDSYFVKQYKGKAPLHWGF